MKKLCKEHDLSFSERRQIKAAAAEFCRTNDGNIIGYNIQFPNGTGVLVYCDKDGWTGFRMPPWWWRTVTVIPLWCRNMTS